MGWEKNNEPREKERGKNISTTIKRKCAKRMYMAKETQSRCKAIVKRKEKEMDKKERKAKKRMERQQKRERRQKDC